MRGEAAAAEAAAAAAAAAAAEPVEAKEGGQMYKGMKVEGCRSHSMKPTSTKYYRYRAFLRTSQIFPSECMMRNFLSFDVLNMKNNPFSFFFPFALASLRFAGPEQPESSADAEGQEKPSAEGTEGSEVEEIDLENG